MMEPQSSSETGDTRHWYLYVLKLEQGNWYVGISTNFEKRYYQHLSGFAGAAWTKKYKPVEIHDTKDLGIVSTDKAKLFESRVTRKYMRQYGINNVRGGDLTKNNDYTPRFGLIFIKEDWRAITVVLFMMLVIAILLVEVYFANIKS